MKVLQATSSVSSQRGRTTHLGALAAGPPIQTMPLPTNHQSGLNRRDHDNLPMVVLCGKSRSQAKLNPPEKKNLRRNSLSMLKPFSIRPAWREKSWSIEDPRRSILKGIPLTV